MVDESLKKKIGPYDTPAEVSSAVERLLQDPDFIDNLVVCIYKGGKRSTRRVASFIRKTLPDVARECLSYEDFQRRIVTKYLLSTIERTSINRFTFSGLNELDRRGNYLFISNHRDIVLDCALLDYAMMFSGYPTLCEMCLGDNLMINGMVTDLFKLTGGITVFRSLSTAREMLNASKELSAYVDYAVNDKCVNVWIAQKSGRSKDGIDDTSAAILKMLYAEPRSRGESFADTVRNLHIVPVAISYEYDPCDITKGREMISRLKNEGFYKKGKSEDLLNMLRGLRKFKGNVHISVGKELTGEYATPADAVREIDRQIHLNYRLFDTNWFCYDLLNGNRDNRAQYLLLNEKAFLKRYKGLNKDVTDFVLNCYANPVRSYLKELGEFNAKD